MNRQTAIGLLALLLATSFARVAPAQSQTQLSYQATPKGLYVWSTGEKSKWWSWRTNDSIARLVHFCRLHGFNKVIVFVGSVQWDWETNLSDPDPMKRTLPHEEDFAALFTALRAANIVPYASFYLNDLPSTLTNYERAADFVDAVLNFNAKYPDARIEGLDGDQEPEIAGANYLRMNTGLVARRNARGGDLHIGAALKPKWLSASSLCGNVSSLADAINSLDGGMVMAYNSEEDTSLSMGTSGLTQAASVNRWISVAIETVDLGEGSTDSFFPMLDTANKDPFFAMVSRMYDEYTTHENFDGFVIHDYDGYYKALYGINPVLATSNPTGLYTGQPAIPLRNFAAPSNAHGPKNPETDATDYCRELADDVTTDPNDVTTDPNDVTTDPNDVTTDPNDVTTDPNDVATDPNDVSSPQEDAAKSGATPSGQLNARGGCATTTPGSWLVWSLTLFAMWCTRRHHRKSL